MDVELAPEQEEFRKIVRAFAEQVVAPRAEAMDRAGALDPVVLDQMAGMGLFGLPFPEEVGGMGADYTTLCLAIEELARVDSSVAITLEAAVGLAAMPIWRYGTAEQHDRWLRPLASGEKLGAFGLTEPGGGSDAAALTTRATRALSAALPTRPTHVTRPLLSVAPVSDRALRKYDAEPSPCSWNVPSGRVCVPML